MTLALCKKKYCELLYLAYDSTTESQRARLRKGQNRPYLEKLMKLEEYIVELSYLFLYQS